MTTRATLRALIVQHEKLTPAGLIQGWLENQGAQLDLLRIYEEERTPDPRDYHLMVSLGSESAAYNDSIPFVTREIKLIRAAHAADVPVLGVCFGSQLMARALGGRSFKAERPEIGWLRVRSTDPDLVPEGPWFNWHFDTFTLPPGATPVAESDAGPQAYMIGRSLGLQFHPEVTVEIVDGWARSSPEQLDVAGVDPAPLLEETKRRAVESKRATERLLNRYIRYISGIPRTVAL